MLRLNPIYAITTLTLSVCMQELQTVYIQKLNIRDVTTETITVHHPIVGGVFPLALINSLHTATLNVVDLSFSVVNTPRHFECG